MPHSNKIKAKKLLAIDASTQSIAYCIWWNKRPRIWGEIKLVGSDVMQRAGDATAKMQALIAMYNVDAAFIEEAIYVQNKKTVIKLAYCYGAIIGALGSRGVKVYGVTPREWMGYIGNTTTPADRARLKRRGVKKYKQAAVLRQERKQYTMDYYTNKFGMSLDNDNVADAVAIGDYAYNKLTER